jgi:hypothetical protein
VAVDTTPLHPAAGLRFTSKSAFLAEMEHVVPWAVLVGLIAP